jgi:IS5 family transposase
MVIKQRTGWGYETLVREVSDSLHLRRFCLIAIDQRVPEESPVRKLARRLGSEVVQEITRVVISKAQRESRFRARAARIDSTVVEADIRYPSDAMLALQGARALARDAKKLTAMVKAMTPRVRDRSRSVGRALRAISRTLARRTGQAKAEVMVLNQQAGRLIARSVKEAQQLAGAVRASARGRGARAKLRAAVKLEQLILRCQKVTEQIDRRARGLKITERLVSLSDPDARPIRKGKLGKPTEFGAPTHPEEPRRTYAIPTRDSSARQLTTGHCPAVPTRASQSDQLSLQSRRPPDPSACATMTPETNTYNRPLDTGVHLRFADAISELSRFHPGFEFASRAVPYSTLARLTTRPDLVVPSPPGRHARSRDQRRHMPSCSRE